LTVVKAVAPPGTRKAPPRDRVDINSRCVSSDLRQLTPRRRERRGCGRSP